MGIAETKRPIATNHHLDDWWQIRKIEINPSPPNTIWAPGNEGGILKENWKRTREWKEKGNRKNSKKCKYHIYIVYPIII